MVIVSEVQILLWLRQCIGLCCLVFDVNYNRETTDNSAIYFKNKNELILQLKSLWHDEKNT